MLGSNVSTQGGFSNAFITADLWGCDCIQFYLTRSRQWDLPLLTEEMINEFKNAWKNSKVKEVVAHIPFLVNLASSDIDLRKRSINRLLTELDYAEKFGVKYLVLHSGSFKNSTRRKGLSNIIKALNFITEKRVNDISYICLETMSGQGNTLGKDLNELSEIFGGLKNMKYFGICLDTAHLFQAGYNLRGYKGFEKLFTEINDKIGIKRLKVIHLNDSKTELGSKHDRHEQIGKGKIGLQFFHAILKDDRLKNVPKILELGNRDEEYQESLKYLRTLQKKDIIREIKSFSSLDSFF